MSEQESKVRLPNSVADAIRAHLPEQVSVMLQARLAAADDAIRDNEMLQERVDQLTAKVRRDSDLTKREKALDERERGLEGKAMVLDDEQRNLRVLQMEANLHAEKRITDVLEKALLGLVRNVEYRKATYGVVPDPSSTCSTYGGTVNVSGTEESNAK